MSLLYKKDPLRTLHLENPEDPQLFRGIFPYTKVGRIEFDDNIVMPRPADPCFITDTTFRDGQQARPPYTVRQFFYARRVVYLPEAFYHYSYNATSILRDPDEVKQEKRLSDIFGNMSGIVEFFRENKSESVYCKEINCRKLRAKLALLSCDPVRWRNTYPEANQYIFSCPTFSWYIKLTEWLCMHGAVWAPRFKDRVAKCVKQFLRR